MKLTELVTRLSLQKNTLFQVESAISEYLTRFHIRSFAMTFYSGHTKSGRKLKYHFVSEALRPWHTHYLEQNYADADRTLEESHTSILPLFWDVHEQLKQAKNTRERRIRLESIEFGIDKGLSIPLYGPDDDFICLTLHQRRNETCLREYQLYQFEWQNAAQLFYHHIKKIIDLNPASISHKLTKREKQCLMLTAKSWRVEKIANELKISPRTVNFHIQNANKKLGTHNKYQSVHVLFAGGLHKNIAKNISLGS